MKARITLLIATMMIALTASAMPYTDARGKALFLSDKMAYELNLTASQYEAAYNINLDYLLNVDDESDLQGYIWENRNNDLKEVLSGSQYDKYLNCEWFYHPFTFNDNGWTLAVYDHYKDGQFFMGQTDTTRYLGQAD